MVYSSFLLHTSCSELLWYGSLLDLCSWRWMDQAARGDGFYICVCVCGGVLEGPVVLLPTHTILIPLTALGKIVKKRERKTEDRVMRKGIGGE